MQPQFQLPTLTLRIPYTISKIDVKNNEFQKCKVDPCLNRRHAIKTYGDQEEVQLHSLLHVPVASTLPSSERTRPVPIKRETEWTSTTGLVALEKRRANTNSPSHGVFVELSTKTAPTLPLRALRDDVCNMEAMCSLCGKKCVLKDNM